MADLSIEDIAALARAAGLPIDDADLVDVTHRFNVLLTGIVRMTHPDLDTVDPFPLPAAEEQSDER